MITALIDRSRVAAAHQVLPIDAARARILDPLVGLAAELARAPIATLTIVEEHRQVFAAHTGLPEEVAAAGSTALDYSICQHAVAQGRPLVVGDARRDPVLRHNRAVVDLGVVAYAGIPLVIGDGYAVGTLCAADVIPREWSDDQVATLAFLADIATDQLELQHLQRAAAFRREWADVGELSRTSARW